MYINIYIYIYIYLYEKTFIYKYIIPLFSINKIRIKKKE